jgi:hypothetical protein
MHDVLIEYIYFNVKKNPYKRKKKKKNREKRIKN